MIEQDIPYVCPECNEQMTLSVLMITRLGVTEIQ